MHHRHTSLAFPLLLLACTVNRQQILQPEDGGPDVAGAMDGPPVGCVPGRIYCAGAMSYRCDEAGQVVDETPCTGVTNTCIEGMGCRGCTAGMTRCDPSNPQRSQTCRADGSGFTDGPLCEANNGETCVAGRCASRCDESATGRSYLGCEYWPTVLANSQLNPRFEYAVVLSNPQTYPVRAIITGGALATPREVNLAPGAIETVILPWVVELAQQGPGAARSALRRGGAYRVRTNGPIAAYQFNPLTFSIDQGRVFSYTNDASLLLPQGVLTQRYTVSTLPGWRGQFGGVVSIVAVTGESTRVVVRPSAEVTSGTGVAGISAGGIATFMLQQGDVVQLVGTGTGDLTGTSIESTLPVAVYVGHDCTNVPADRVACDHLEEQLFPNETWGRDYFVSALRDRGATNPSIVRIVSQLDDNVITFDPPVLGPRTLRAGQVVELSTAQHFRVRGTRAFLVSQYMIGQGPLGFGGSDVGDPAMVLEVPTAQYRTQYDFYVPSTYPRNFFNLVAPIGATLTMDGAPLRGSSEVVSGQTVYTLPIEAGPHRVRSADLQPFGVKVYGVARYTSYMYPGGLDLRILPPG